MHIALFFFFAGLAHAQYNQRWNWVPNINAQGQPILDAQGNPTTKAQWRPNNDLGTPWKDVIFPSTSNVLPQGIELEYNCFRMPAICQNVANWRTNAALSGWHVGSNWDHWFTYDLGASKSTLDRGDARRELQCPRNWKVQPNGRPTCPMAGQPQVVPPLWDANGLPVMQIIPQVGTQVYLKIADGRDQQFVGQTQDSGRMYSCDEFPPASWIEGGHGIGGTPTAAQGTTYCAPIAVVCLGDDDARGSEQNWQGSIHKVLSTVLETRIGPDGDNLQYDVDTPIAFRFTTSTQPNNVVWAARVLTDYGGVANQQERKPGTHWQRRSDDSQPAEILLVPIENGNGSSAIHLSNGEVFRPHEHKSLDPLLHRIRQLARREAKGPAVTEVSNQTASVEWHVTAEDVDPSLTSYGLETQQNPVGAIDIIGLSEQYILAQIESNQTTSNGTLTNNITVLRRWQSPHTKSHAVHHNLHLQRRVDGPIQCGVGQPCLDGSCCNKLGKCGYKAAQCAPDNCLSNCDAKAMCGIDSADGRTLCGLKLCCSFYGWCGTEDVHCKDPEPLIGKTPCQEGFGSCEIKPSPSCGPDSGTSKARRIAYYQGWNTRERVCDKVSPRQINTRGLTHLLYAFAFFHPQTFEMMPMNAGDIALYGEFTALKRNGLQTWIAVGGWSFNDPETATYNAYSDMVSTEVNRRAFIQSLIKFMDTYGFQGADIDWEYPAEPKRGGRKADTDNLVLLMKEMKEQFSGRFGSSLTLAPDYWYLRGFKPAAMQSYVDWMGFMSYDLHGPWDTDVKTLGSKVRPQTDITEIQKNLKPLWFDGVDPAKIVMGIAYYGRTYKLADASCGKMGCSFISGEGGAPGSCTNSAGVLSNREIKKLINDESITPYFNETAMVKYFTYGGDSWVGYDDVETYALKEAFANDHCLGGIMIWSIDFDDGTGVGLGDANDYKSPESATIIPMAHTTVPVGQTFTLGSGAATDIPRLPNGGTQNSPQGPGPSMCEQCSFFRLITSTCCGTGGSVGNPILIPARVPTPMDIPLPSGFIPSQPFTDADGVLIPANQPLPRETIIPQGTIFTQPFVIAPGSLLHEGEGEDQNSNSSNLVWLSPEVWNDPNPHVQCFFPCTFVLPPYISFTTTVDYPRVTVTESGTVKTTLTFPPLTVTSWAPTTIVVSGRSGCTDTATCTNTADNRRTSTVDISRSTTWPWVTWTSSGTRYLTRAPGPSVTPTTNPKPDPQGGSDSGDDPCLWPFCPPRPPHLSLPHITINFGLPKPTTTPCAWPTLTCAPRPNPGPGPGNGPHPTPGPIPILTPADSEPEEEDEEEQSEICVLRQKTTKRVTRTVGVIVTATSDVTTWTEPTKTSTTTTTTKKSEPTLGGPDWSKDVTKCYDSGQWTRRGRMISAADNFCNNYLKGQTITEKWNPGTIKQTFDIDTNEVVSVEIIAFVEAKAGCAWKVDVDVCKGVFRKIIDNCDTNGENRKQGGRVVGDCLTWRLDPNADP